MLYITDSNGVVQVSYQLGTGNMSEPWIDDVAIDAQLQMWHTHEYNTYISRYRTATASWWPCTTF